MKPMEPEFTAFIPSTPLPEAAGYLNDVHAPGDLVTSWEAALSYLKSGNRRYRENRTAPRAPYSESRAALKDDQRPFAAILTCSDSRVVPEVYFDQSPGDIFVIRSAGHVACSTALGSIEYAVDYLGVRLVVVVGHSRCGAVNAAFNGGEYSRNLQKIVDAVTVNIAHQGSIDGAIRANTESAARKIRENAVVTMAGAAVLGAHYDIESGLVTWPG